MGTYRSIPARLGLLAVSTITLAVPAGVDAQAATATLTGAVLDESHAALPDVSITVGNLATGSNRAAVTNADGFFSVSALAPGRYSLTATRQGFATFKMPEIVLSVEDSRSITLVLKVGAMSETTVVQGTAPAIAPDSPAVATAIDRTFVEELPLNGHTLQALLELTPGVVIVKGAGQFSASGQRHDANYFLVDGVGANAGISAAPSLGAAAGGSLPAFDALGTTAGLVGVDDVQEFRVETSTYPAEFGRAPGAQVSVVSRAGTNRYTGDAFELFRHDALQANDWFANRDALAKPRLRQNDFGGTVGGPLRRGRTFFFVSYERLRLDQPQIGITPVPTLDTRQHAPAAMAPYLLAFPLPNGRDFGNGMAEFAASYANPSSFDAAAIRIDHSVAPSTMLFGRYASAPSSARTRGAEGLFNALSSVSTTRIDTFSLTAGLTATIGRSVTHELRINLTRSRGANRSDLDSFGGAIPPAAAQLLPSFATADSLILFGVLNPNAGLVAGSNVDNRQQQLNVVDTVAFSMSSHLVKIGVDYRRLSPVLDVLNYGQQVLFQNVEAAVTGQATNVNIFSTPATRYPRFENVSAYLQDAWRVSGRVTLTTGIRWECNPPPSEANGNVPYTITGLDNPATMTLAPEGTPLWKTRYADFAPRAGAAIRLRDSGRYASVLRGGAGLYFDLGTGASGNAFAQSAFGYFSNKFLANVPYPLDAGAAAPAPTSISPPYSNLVVADPGLVVPRVYQWSTTLDQSLGSAHILSVTYLGAAGRRLLRTETLLAPNPQFGNLSVITNGGDSDYEALQAQYRHPLSRGFQTLASYTLARSLDNSSDESASFVSATRLEPSLDRGPSDFDVRHTLSGALAYVSRSASSESRWAALKSNWSLAAVVRARSAAPVNVVAQGFLFGVRQVRRPDRVPNVPLYLNDRSAPGGMRFNAAAFASPAGQQGTLPRNAIRGFAASQLDVSLRRRFHVASLGSVELGADVFNVLNHPNFDNPDPLLGDGPEFGVSSKMLNQGLGGLNPVYQFGGPRSAQLTLRLQLGVYRLRGVGQTRTVTTWPTGNSHAHP